MRPAHRLAAAHRDFLRPGRQDQRVVLHARNEGKGHTREVWFYDLRTNMPGFGKTNLLAREYFDGFIKAFTAFDRAAAVDERWSRVTRADIAAKGDSLDLGLIRDESVLNYEDLADPVQNGEETIAQLKEAIDLIQSVVKELKSLERGAA